MEGATENQDISATQAALAESMAQLQMIKVLIRRKVFQKQRYRGQWYCVAIDASGVTGRLAILVFLPILSADYLL
jgi:hypothetical protein